MIFTSKMPQRRPPPHLWSCALKSLMKTLQKTCTQIHPEDLADLRNHLRSHLTPSLWGLWVQTLLDNKAIVTRDLKFLIFGPALESLDLDLFYSTECEALNSIPLASNVKVLTCKYAPFQWRAAERDLFERSIIHLKDLRCLTLQYLDLTEAPITFFETIGVHCIKLRELDISHCKIPAQHFEVISRCASSLEVLVSKSKEGIQHINRGVVRQLLTSLKKLRIFDDDTGHWSCILPTLSTFEKEDCSLLEYLPVYQTLQTPEHYLQSVNRILLTSRLFKQRNYSGISTWIQNFPSLKAIDLRLEKVHSSAIETFLRNVQNPSQIYSISLSQCHLDFEIFRLLGLVASNLKKLEIIDIQLNGPEWFLPHFDCRNLQYLSYSGKLDNWMASFLLNGCPNLEELHLKTETLPAAFLLRNQLIKLQYLRLDVRNSINVEFLLPIVKNALSLNTIQISSELSPQLKRLQQQLNAENFQVLITN